MGRDYILIHGVISTSGAEVKMQVIAGNANIRTGYGTCRLMSIQCLYTPVGSGTEAPTGAPVVKLRNSNWTRPLILNAAWWEKETALSEHTHSYEPGYNAELRPNSNFDVVVSAVGIPASVSYNVYALIEVDYASVQCFEIEKQTGYPMSISTPITASTTSNVLRTIATPDNLDPGISYLLREIRIDENTSITTGTFLVISGFQQQNGLIKIVPIKVGGAHLVNPLKVSPQLTKQSYNIGIVTASAWTNKSISVVMTMIASANSI